MNETTQSQGEPESDCFNVTDAKELMELGASIGSAAALSNINEMLPNNEDGHLAKPPFRTLTSATKVFPPKQMSDLSETPPSTEGDNVGKIGRGVTIISILWVCRNSLSWTFAGTPIVRLRYRVWIFVR